MSVGSKHDERTTPDDSRMPVLKYGRKKMNQKKLWFLITQFYMLSSQSSWQLSGSQLAHKTNKSIDSGQGNKWHSKANGGLCLYRVRGGEVSKSKRERDLTRREWMQSTQVTAYQFNLAINKQQHSNICFLGDLDYEIWGFPPISFTFYAFHFIIVY